MTIHGLVDRALDELCVRGPEAAETPPALADAKAYIRWFARQMEASHA